MKRQGFSARGPPERQADCIVLHLQGYYERLNLKGKENEDFVYRQ